MPHKVLFIGDMHVEPHDIHDATKIIDYAIDLCNDHSVDTVVFMGDQFHNHSILHVAVLHFWNNSFSKLNSLSGAKVTALVGNHDIPNDDNVFLHSHIAFDKIEVVKHYFIDRDILYVGYQKDTDLFVRICNNNPKLTTVVCHQEFDGAVYENGFYAKHGIKPDSLPQKTVLSGHIHNRQTFGKVNYLGSPRWKNLNDANEDKVLEIITFEGSEIISRETFSTNEICRRIIKLIDREHSPLDLSGIDTKDKIYIDVYGSKDYINKRKKIYTEVGFLVKTIPNKEASIKVKESEGISKSLFRFAEEYSPPNNTPNDTLLNLVKERIVW